MIYFILTMVFIIAMFAISDEPNEQTITLDDVNVGDVIKIKGETFIVKAYSSNGNVEIEEVGDNAKSYIINVNDDTILTAHKNEGKRLFITIDNFKGTIGGDYLNKIKVE